jgi:hypothetical protein
MMIDLMSRKEGMSGSSIRAVMAQTVLLVEGGDRLRADVLASGGAHLLDVDLDAHVARGGLDHVLGHLPTTVDFYDNSVGVEFLYGLDRGAPPAGGRFEYRCTVRSAST